MDDPAAADAGWTSDDVVVRTGLQPKPVHGSAPDIAGQGIANPIATLLSGEMLSRDQGPTLAADALGAAIAAAVATAAGRTPDLGGSASTRSAAGPSPPHWADSLAPHVRVAIVSDTHMPRGQRRLPDACVDLLRDADLILHAGDLVRVEVLDLIEAIGPPVHAIHGNVDDEAVRARLPETRTVDAGGARIGMVHDPGPSQGRLARLHDRFRDADAVVFGHTHQPEHLTDSRTGFQAFNPGSPTERRRAPAHTMGLATVAPDGTLAFEHVTL